MHSVITLYFNPWYTYSASFPDAAAAAAPLQVTLPLEQLFATVVLWASQAEWTGQCLLGCPAAGALTDPETAEDRHWGVGAVLTVLLCLSDSFSFCDGKMAPSS